MKSVLNPNSIQFRLTVGMVLASVVGIGGFTGWMNWRMRALLIESHKDNALLVADRLGDDASLYEQTMVPSEALAMAIDYREQPDVAIWVVNPDGQVLAQSSTLSMGSWQVDGFATKLMEVVHQQSQGLNVMRLQDRHLITCVSPLTVNGQTVGSLYVVDDITEDHASLARITRTLALSSLLAIGLGAVATSLYIRQAMRPICKMNQLAANVSAENLADTRLEFDGAPTEVQELAQTCNMMISRLSAAWDQQRRFVSDVSHELRTPLTLVHGYLQSTLRRGDNLSAPQKEGLEIAADEADRTIRLLQDLLDLARADGGNLRYQIKREPLHAVVGEVLEMGQYTCDRIHSNLDSAEARSVEASVDSSRLKQVLINLIDNALKYSEADKPISVTLKRVTVKGGVVKTGAVKTGAVKTGGAGGPFPGETRAHIEIKDHGRGIPLTDLTKIFEPFYRVDEDRSRATGGTGLGLSIVKTLVEGMNGTLKVHSKLGEGSVFTVSLPT